MSSKRTIRVKDIAHDIRAGMTDAALMQKYQLTPKGLDTVFTRLLETQALTFSELQKRSPAFDADSSYVPSSSFRSSPRDEIGFPLAVYDKKNPAARGIVTDISENGLGMRGMKIAVNEIRTLVVRADDLFQMEPIECEAICRWVKPSHDVRNYVGGFEIQCFLSGDLKTLQNLLQALTLEERVALKKKTIRV